MKFLDESHRAPLIDVERRVVARFADAVATLRPGERDVHLHKPLTMLLFA